MAGASSRSSPILPGCSYHISIFQGDTGETFSHRLFVALTEAGFLTFQNDQKIGRIQCSNICIIIFFKGYASSKVRLDKLVKILQCYGASCSRRIVPVYYDVDRSDVRNQLESFEEAFAVYEKEIEDESDDEMKGKLREDVTRWRKALRDVEKFAGFNLRNVVDGSESEEELIEKIVREMEDRVSRAVQTKLIGIPDRAKKLNQWVQDS